MTKSDSDFNEALIFSEDGREMFAGFFQSKSGVEKIYYKRDQPNSSIEPKIHLFAVHDMGQYHGSFDSIKKFLIEEFSDDITITLIDLKGHGLSSGTRTFINDFKEYQDDVLSLVEREKDKKSIKILLGQGMGALVCLQLLHQLNLRKKDVEISGAILSNPLLKLELPIPQYAKFALRGWHNGIAGRSLGKIRLSYDDSHFSSQLSNPLIQNQITISLLSEILKVGEELKNTSYLVDLPLCFFIGERGELCNIERISLYHKGILKRYSHCSKFKDSGHDLFNDSKKENAFHDLSKWLNKLKPGPNS